MKEKVLEKSLGIKKESLLRKRNVQRRKVKIMYLANVCAIILSKVVVNKSPTFLNLKLINLNNFSIKNYNFLV